MGRNLVMGRVGGVVLCGGESRRMGRSKALLEYDGEPMLGRVVRVVSSHAAPVVVAHRPGQALPALVERVQWVSDPIAGVGPLGGLLGGLGALADRCDAVFVCACDQPLLRAAFVGRMIERLAHHRAVLVRHADRLHALTGVYRTDVVPWLRRQLDSGDYRVRVFAEHCKPLVLTGDAFDDVDPELESLRNVNSPEDMPGREP